MYEGKYPLVSALSRPVIVKHLVRRGPRARRRRRRPRLHRQGQRPGALRGVDARRSLPTSRCIAPVRDWGMTREDSILYAYHHDIPITATKEKLYSIDDNLWGRAIECGEMEDPWAVPPPGVWALTDADGDRAARGRRSASSRACPSRSTATRCRSHELIARARTASSGAYGWGRLDMVENRRVGIKSRETYECPAALALILAHADLESHHPRARPPPREGAARAPLRRARLRRAVVLAAQAGARRVRRREPAVRHRRGAAAARARPVLRNGRRSATASTTTASPPTTPPTRSATRTPRASCGSGASASRRGRSARAGRSSSRDALARPLRRGPGRRAAGVHRVSLPLRPAARRATTSPARARTSAAWCGRASSTATRPTRSSPRSTRVADELADGSFEFAAGDEDIHTAIERRVTEIAGAGRRQAAHRPQPQRPGRHRPAAVRPSASSRSVAAARRRPAAGAARPGRARPATRTCPGYTHLQRAQPVLLAHHLLAHGWALARDVDRLLDDSPPRSTCRRSARARSPARRCRSIPDGTAADLGFAAAFENSLDAVSDRDFVAEALFDLALARRAPVAASARRWCCGRPTSSASRVLDDAYATGSSMMPQKKNPDIAELARGKAGRLDRPPHRASSRRSRACRSRTTAICRRTRSRCSTRSTRSRSPSAPWRGWSRAATFDLERMAAAADDPMLAATDLAELLGRRRHAVPRGARGRRARWFASRSSRARRWPTSWGLIPDWAPRPPRSSNPARPCGAG